MSRLSTTLLAGVAMLGFVSATQAADLIVDYAPVEPGVIVASGGNWDGAYVGIFAGYGWGAVDHIGVIPGLFDAPGADLDIEGWQLGVKGGVDFSAGSGLVVGLVGDLAWSNQSGEGLFEDVNIGADSALVTYELDWQGSIRGRVGLDAEAFLPYVTAGLAFAHVDHTIDIDGGPFDGVDAGDATYIGWTAGAGVEFAVADNMSLNLEYRYTDFGEQTIDMGLDANNPSFAITSHALTAGINFRF